MKEKYGNGLIDGRRQMETKTVNTIRMDRPVDYLVDSLTLTPQHHQDTHRVVVVVSAVVCRVSKVPQSDVRTAARRCIAFATPRSHRPDWLVEQVVVGWLVGWLLGWLLGWLYEDKKVD